MQYAVTALEKAHLISTCTLERGYGKIMTDGCEIEASLWP